MQFNAIQSICVQPAIHQTSYVHLHDHHRWSRDRHFSPTLSSTAATLSSATSRLCSQTLCLFHLGLFLDLTTTADRPVTPSWRLREVTHRPGTLRLSSINTHLIPLTSYSFQVILRDFPCGRLSLPRCCRGRQSRSGATSCALISSHLTARSLFRLFCHSPS